MIEILICLVVFSFMCWLFSWKLPVFITKLLIGAGIIITIGYLIGIGFKLAGG
jgi:hypothetical protein